MGQNDPRTGSWFGPLALCATLSVHAACSQAHPSATSLSTQGLYEDIVAKRVAPEVIEYIPEYALWSDGVQKRRWIWLPEGAVIDTSDMDHWQFPIGTKLFKEFSLYGQLLETRLVERIADTGRFDRDFKLATYVWREDQLDAEEVAGGVTNVMGTTHDVPAQKLCRECHRGEPSGVLGFSALQLSRSGILTRLAEQAKFSVDPQRTFEFPGDEIQAQAAGYLHANCGHCHSATGLAPGDMHLRFSVAEVDGPIEDSELYATTIGQAITEWKDHPRELQRRVVPGEPERSAIYYRMKQRGVQGVVRDQMPPLATEQAHLEGLALIKAWIATLPAELNVAGRPLMAADVEAREPVQSDADAGAASMARVGGMRGAAVEADAGVDAAVAPED